MRFFRKADPVTAKPAPATTKDTAAGPDHVPVYVAGAVALILGLLSISIGMFDAFDRRWSDRLFQFRGMEPADPRVLVIAIDDESIKSIGQYPWPRHIYKQIIDSLLSNGVKVVALDVMFIEPSTANEDRALIQATSAWGNRVVHAINRDPSKLNQNVFRYPFEALRKVSKSLGAVDQLVIDSDGSVRNTTLLFGKHVRDSTKWESDPDRLPGLGTKALSVYEGKSPDDYVKRHGNFVYLNVRGEVENKVGESQNAEGETIEVKKREYGIQRIPVWQVLEKPMDDETKAKLKDAIVLIGYTALGTYDHFPSPFTESQPGVEVHAIVIDNLLNNRFIRAVPGYATVFFCFLFAALSTGMLSFGPMIGAVVMTATLFLWAGFTYYLFLSLRLIDFTAPSLSLVGTFSMLLVRKALSDQREKRFIKQTFGQFVAPEVVEKLVRDPSLVRLGGEKREMTVFFLDIAHFTTISEKMDAESLIIFLNRYLSALSKVVQDHKGVVDKYIGDCIMAFWNAPLDDPEHHANACVTAVECQAVMAELNKNLDPKLPERPAIRIGLNSGDMTVGLTGSEKKLAYTVIGDEVNLASRLEGANKFFGSHIMVSEACYEGGKGVVEARILGQVRVVGKSIPIKVFELIALKGKLSPEWQKALPLYEKGVELFLGEKFAEAKESFAAVLKLLPEDKPSKLYLNACEDYTAIPPMGDWRVFNLTAK